MLGSRICRLCNGMNSNTRGYKVKKLIKLMDEEDLPRINVPHKLVQNLEIKKARVADAKRRDEKPVYTGPIAIKCRNKQFDHRKGQPYSDFNPQSLASHGWKNSKSDGDYFVLQPLHGNPSVLPDSESPTFKQLGVKDKLVQSLEETGITKATNIQAATIPKFLEGHNVLCAAETGSGKTLSYLLPMLQKAESTRGLYQEGLDNSPLGIIVVPAGELADQVHKVSYNLAESLNLKSRILCGGRGTGGMLKKKTRNTCDILITTPGVLYRLLLSKLYSVQRLQMLIFDEADSLLDDSFNNVTKGIMQHMKLEVADQAAGYGTQLGFIAATLPRDINNILADLVPMDKLEKITTYHLHRLMPHIPQKFIRVKPSMKPEQLLKLLKTGRKKKVPTIVFCNKTTTIYFLKDFLESSGIDHVVLHSKMSKVERKGRFDRFQNGECDLLLCTDVASRGLDTIRAQHIINYEFPNFVSDYVHRAGRVGRVSSVGTGFVLSFVAHKWEVDLLWQIERAARRFEELHNVNANAKRKLRGRHEDKQMRNELIDSEVNPYELLEQEKAFFDPNLS